MKINGIVYRSCVRSALCYGSETWCLGLNEIGIAQATARVALVDKKSTKELMQMLDLNETMDQLARANSVCWHGHVLRKDMNNFPRRALDLTVKGTRKTGRPKKTWLKAVIEQSRKVGLNESDANNRSR